MLALDLCVYPPILEVSKMKFDNKISDWVIILLAFVTAVVPFVLSTPMIEFKIMLPAVSIVALSIYIRNEKIRRSIGTICLLVIIIVCIKVWFG